MSLTYESMIMYSEFCNNQGSMLRGPPPPRFMLPQIPSNPEFRSRKTGWIDKLVDYVVGDGPANRFALICRYCATHNGLATPEDFPYIGKIIKVCISWDF